MILSGLWVRAYHVPCPEDFQKPLLERRLLLTSIGVTTDEPFVDVH
jgi:hypothetical protein